MQHSLRAFRLQEMICSCNKLSFDHSCWTIAMKVIHSLVYSYFSAFVIINEDGGLSKK